MATTTNFGWETPDDTDLVKDGAAAIRTLGGAIDTSLVDLKGGTTGQILSKASNTDLDFTWTSETDPNAIAKTIVDAKGDLIAATAADTVSRLAVGTNGQVLTADSTTATGLKWAAAGGGMTLISDLSPSSATSISITGIAGTYKHLCLLITGTGNDDQGWGVRFNNNSNNDYSFNGFYNDRPTTSAQVLESWNTSGFGTDNPAKFGLILSQLGSTYGNAIGEMWIYNYADSANQKVIRWTAYGSQEISGGAYGRFVTATGSYEELAAISRIDFIRSSTNTFTGKVRLYGVD